MHGRAPRSVWGGILLSGGSTLFWVPILAYACNALGAAAGPVFWFGFAAVMFGLGIALWAVLQGNIREAAAGSSLAPSSAEVLRLDERRSGRRTAQA